MIDGSAGKEIDGQRGEAECGDNMKSLEKEKGSFNENTNLRRRQNQPASARPCTRVLVHNRDLFINVYAGRNAPSSNASII